jgi:hypothetical protein
MVLFNDIVQIFNLTNRDIGAAILVIGPDGRGIGPTPIDGDRLWDAVTANCLGEKTPRGGFGAYIVQVILTGIVNLVEIISEAILGPQWEI